MRGFGFLGFVALTAVCWGVYGPVLHHGQLELGANGELSTLRSLICVGIAYFLIAVIFPVAVLVNRGEKGNWSMEGFVWSFVAGAVGAIGALGIILAFKFDGTPVFVMPLVFGCAPVMNTIVTMLMNRSGNRASLVFYAGILIVAIGAVGVLTFKPSKKVAAAPSPTATAQETTENSEASSTDVVGSTSAETVTQNPSDLAAQEPATTRPVSKKGVNLLNLLCVMVTALCWGAYGPVLHHGQSKMNGSRLRPFLCVGLAYFAIAVVVPSLLLLRFTEAGGWDHGWGVLWSLMGGVAGAVGALGIIYAFNFGGKPLFVMPLVFGGAPVVNTFVESYSKGILDQIEMPFFISLGLVIAGAVTVLVSAPKGPGKPVAVPLEAPVN
jgi:hypothetical protein